MSSPSPAPTPGPTAQPEDPPRFLPQKAAEAFPCSPSPHRWRQRCRSPCGCSHGQPEKDILPGLLAQDSTTIYALVSNTFSGEDDTYSRSSLFARWGNAEEHLSPPLVDTEEYPDVLLVGHSGHISEHLMFQGILTLVNDPDSGITREGLGLLRSERWQKNTPRADNQNSDSEFRLVNQIESALY